MTSLHQKSLLFAPPPVFLVEFDRSTSVLRLHVNRGADADSAVEAVRSAGGKVGQNLDIVVQSHDRSDLAFPKSIEHWLNKFSVGEIVSDPTMIFSRARALVQAAVACRHAAGRKIRGIFFSPARRTIVVLMKANKSKNATLNSGQSSTQPSNVEFEIGGKSFLDTEIKVEVVTRLPRTDLVPVDKASSSRFRWVRGALRRWIGAAVLVLVTTFGVAPASASVDSRSPNIERNAKVSGWNDAQFDRYGFLAGLSVFADGHKSYSADAFTSTGLELYFGDSISADQKYQVAQVEDDRRRRRRRRDERGLGQDRDGRDSSITRDRRELGQVGTPGS